MRQTFYILDRDGRTPRAVPVWQWAEWFETADRTVARTAVGNVSVSTVFLGSDHQYGDGPPVLWETMVFDAAGNGGDCDRYTSHDDAVAGHAAIVARLQVGGEPE